MAHLYYLEDARAQWWEGGLLEVAGAEARHAVTVARLCVGEGVLVGDGRGVIAETVVEETGRDRFLASVQRIRRTSPNSVSTTIVQALPKQDRADTAIELATEFGADTLIPWQAARSISRWRTEERKQKGAEKWRRIAREAAKQSVRPHIPRVQPPVNTAQLQDLFIASDLAHTNILLLDPEAQTGMREYVGECERSAVAATKEWIMVIGPEGGIAPDEQDALIEAGAHPVRLGETVLRTAHAAAAALTMLHTLLGKW